MEKLQPPAPAEIIPAEPIEDVSDDAAVGMLSELPADEQQALAVRAGSWLDEVQKLNPHSQEFSQQVQAISRIASNAFESTAGSSSRFMQKSLRDARAHGSDNQQHVSGQLVKLRTTMEELAPDHQTFTQKALAWIPGMNVVMRYFRSFEANQTQLNAILTSLAKGQEGLQRDNAELAVERRRLWDDLHALQKAAELLSHLDEQVAQRAADAAGTGQADLARALEGDVLFAVRQRRQDVQTQIAVTIQAYMAMGLIEDNNRKLIQGVDRARTTTVTALRTAVITAQALENQRIVLDQIDAINRTTNDLIDRTSEMLQQNTLRVQEQAVQSGVAPETLERAFNSLFATMDSLDSFRSKANENFLTTITRLERQVERAKPYLDRMNDDEAKKIGEAGQLSQGADCLLELN